MAETPTSTIETPVVVAPTHVAVFGCPVAGRTFRALMPGKAQRDSAARTLTIPRCPGCGDEHGVLHMGRDRMPGESVNVCIGGTVDLGPPPKPTTPPAREPTSVSPGGRRANQQDHRHKFTDAELLAALTAERQRASDVARALGAKQSSTIVERCRKLADALVIEQGRGRPILVQLAAK